MNIQTQFEAQLERAYMCRGVHPNVTLKLYWVKFPGIPPHISIIGGTIVTCAPELWQARGAQVRLLYVLEPYNGPARLLEPPVPFKHLR